MQSVCVYCGSSLGIDANCQVAAMSMGKSLANRNLTMVYGGGRVGLMGIAADAALQAGGEVVGVIPEALGSDEIAHSGLSKLHFVRSMHERKAKMADLSDGFVALPGGLGTLDELFEIWTWRQLKFHNKPIGLLNVDGFFDSLLAYLDAAVAKGFVKQKYRAYLLVSKDSDELLDRLSAAEVKNRI